MSNKVIAVLAVVVAGLSASMLFVFANPRPASTVTNTNQSSVKLNESYNQAGGDNVTNGNVATSVEVVSGEVTTAVTVAQ